MKLRNKLFFFTIIFILAIGCRASKTVYKDKEVIVKDTVNIFKDRIVTKQVNDTIVIDKICDTLGNLKNFDRVINTGSVKVSLKSVNGGLKATINIDSIVNSKVSEFKSNYKTEKIIVKEKVVTNIIPFKIWIIISLESLIILLLIKLKWF